MQSHIVVGEHRSRGDLPIAFRGTVIFSATFPSLTASPLSFVAVLTRSSCPIMPMMQSTLPNNSAQVSLTAATSPKCRTIGNCLSVLQAVSTSALRCSEVGVFVCECGKVTALKASADHRFASCAAMQGFQPLCFAPMVFRTAPSGTCTTLCLCRHHLLLLFRSRFDPAGFHSLNFILRRKVMAYRGTARASLHSVFLAVSVPCNDAITLAFAAIRSQCHFVAV